MIQQIADGRTDLVFDWLAAGNNPRTKEIGGTSLIRWVAYHGDVSALKLLLEAGESLESLGSDKGLNAAAFHGHWQLVQYLIEQGGKVNGSLSATGETPLHAATCKANRPIYDHVIKLLLAAGANPNATTLVDVESGCFMRDCRTVGETPLHRAAAFGTEQAVELLLKAGADRQMRDAHGDTPLSWASMHLRPASVLRLLCYGDYQIHPDNSSSYDHGAQWGLTDAHLRGRPHC